MREGSSKADELKFVEKEFHGRVFEFERWWCIDAWMQDVKVHQNTPLVEL